MVLNEITTDGLTRLLHSYCENTTQHHHLCVSVLRLLQLSVFLNLTANTAGVVVNERQHQVSVSQPGYAVHQV